MPGLYYLPALSIAAVVWHHTGAKPSPGLAAAESTLIVSFRPSCNRQCRGSFSLGGSPNEPRTWVPDTSVLAGGDLVRLIVARDTARLRRVAREADSTAMARVFFNAPFQRAQEAYLALGDTAAALRVTRVSLDSASMYGRFVSRALAIGPLAPMVGMMRQRGELAAALGLREEALTWIDRVLDLWADASPEFQPDVARLRALRAKVAGRQ